MKPMSAELKLMLSRKRDEVGCSSLARRMAHIQRKAEYRIARKQRASLFSVQPVHDVLLPASAIGRNGLRSCI